jgi:uncharacterized protein YggE
VPEPSGYVVLDTVSVTLTDLGQVGRVIDTALAAGANQPEGLAWTLGDDHAVRLRALRRAVAAARAKVQAVADELGMRRARVVSVAEGAGEGGPRPMMLERSVAAADVATPTEPARLTFRSYVTLTAELAAR